MKKASAVLAVTALAALGLAACGGSSNDNGTTAAATSASTTVAAGGASSVDISTPSGSTLAFDQKDATAKAGTVTVSLDNKQALQHDVAIADSSGKVLGQTALVAGHPPTNSGTASTTVKLTPGTYTFYCTVPGHRQAGMEGTLTVK